MKKIFACFAAVLMTLGMSAASYGIMIDGTDYHPGELNPNPGDPSFQEYMVLGVTVSAGSTLQLYDANNQAGWTVDLDQASVTTITRDGDHYVCSTEGCYNFYIKLKMNSDQLYIGSCSGDQPGGGEQTPSYGIMINGTDYHAGTENPTPGDPTFKEYMVLGVTVPANASLQLYDANNQAGWAVDLDQASVTTITRDGDHYVCSTEGCYNFYIKLKMNSDQLYIGSCSGDQPGGGGQGGGEDPDDINYYAFGWINGADHGDAAHDVYEDDLLFVDGKLTINCTMGSYIGIKDHTGNFYRSKTQTSIADTQVTLDWQDGTWTNGQPWAIPEGVNYIIIRSATWKGQIKLERVDKATYDAYHYGNSHGIENTEVSEKARKVIIDGQLRIVRGDKLFDATGREL